MREDSTRSALDGFNQREGVCRDFAHLAVTFCRCMNIPARYCTVNEVHDRLHPGPALRRLAEELPGGVRQLVGIAVLTAPGGRITVSADCLVQDSGLVDDYAPDAVQHPGTKSTIACTRAQPSGVWPKSCQAVSDSLSVSQ
jgi:hypothetical protein